MTFAELVQQLKNSQLYRDDPVRLRLLLETLRIVYNDLPFRFVEYQESMLLDQIAVEQKMTASFSAKTITHSIVELYATTKQEVANFIAENRLPNGRCFTLMADFWSAKAKNAKYLGKNLYYFYYAVTVLSVILLGLRLYMVDNDWNFRSILLGTREFDPDYDERKLGIKVPFKRWIMRNLEDFGLELTDFFGSTTDSGPDVKSIMRDEEQGLGLEWEWCVPHMVHAATKMGRDWSLSSSLFQPLTVWFSCFVCSFKGAGWWQRAPKIQQ